MHKTPRKIATNKSKLAIACHAFTSNMCKRATKASVESNTKVEMKRVTNNPHNKYAQINLEHNSDASFNYSTIYYDPHTFILRHSNSGNTH